MDKRIMKRRLFGIVDEVDLFEAETLADEYVDTGDVLELLRWIRVELHCIIDVKQKGIT